MTRVFTSWSGGKDSCLAYYRAMMNGMDVRHLANIVTGDGQSTTGHGITAAIIQAQADALEIPIVQWRTNEADYETEFVRMLRSFRMEDIRGGIFGDIASDSRRAWIEQACHQAEIIPFFPIWMDDQRELLLEFIEEGFEAIVIAARADIFDAKVLGRTVDADFLKYLDELSARQKIDYCGEAGEYHTLVTDGPIFKQRLEIPDAPAALRDNLWRLDIPDVALIEK